MSKSDLIRDAEECIETCENPSRHYMVLLQSCLDQLKADETELGLIKIQLEHRTTLLSSCEKALEERDADEYKDIPK